MSVQGLNCVVKNRKSCKLISFTQVALAGSNVMFGLVCFFVFDGFFNEGC